MIVVPRKEINAAHKKYRNNYRQLGKFNCGFSGFAEFLGVDSKVKHLIYFSTLDKIPMPDLAASKIKAILLASPDNIKIMLKVAIIKYEASDGNISR